MYLKNSRLCNLFCGPIIGVMDEIKKRGRPPTRPEDRLLQRTVRLKPSAWDKIDRMGMEWLRKLIDRAKPPPK